jgi:O-antigen ligase
LSFSPTAISRRLADFGGRSWLDTPGARRTAAAATLAGLVIVAMLPDFVENVNLLRPVFLLMAGLVAVLLLTTRLPRPGWTELGLVVLCAAIVWPGFSHGQWILPGTMLFMATSFGIGRLSGLKPATIALVLLAAGAFMGVVAIAQTVPHFSSLVPWQPMLHGAVNGTSRATGFFNNPNTFGGYEAATLLVAAMFGLPWDQPPTHPGRAKVAVLAGAISLCLIGMGLSVSRESFLGLAVGLAVLAAMRFHQPRPGRNVVVPVLIAAIVAAAVVLLVGATSLPVAPARYNPLGMAGDQNLNIRILGWRAAVSFILRAPLIGYGPTVPVLSVDNLYLLRLLSGGVIGLGLWLGGLAAAAPRRAWPMLAATLAIGILAPSLSIGPGLAILLVSCGLYATRPAGGG